MDQVTFSYPHQQQHSHLLVIQQVFPIQQTLFSYYLAIEIAHKVCRSQTVNSGDTYKQSFKIPFRQLQTPIIIIKVIQVSDNHENIRSCRQIVSQRGQQSIIMNDRKTNDKLMQIKYEIINRPQNNNTRKAQEQKLSLKLSETDLVEESELFMMDQSNIQPQKSQIENSQFVIEKHHSANVSKNQLQFINELNKLNLEMDSYMSDKQEQKRQLYQIINQNNQFLKDLQAQDDNHSQNTIKHKKNWLKFKGRRKKFTINSQEYYKLQNQTQFVPIYQQPEQTIKQLYFLSHFKITTEIKPHTIKFTQQQHIPNVVKVLKSNNYQYCWDDQLEVDWEDGDMGVIVGGLNGQILVGNIGNSSCQCILYQKDHYDRKLGLLSFKKKEAKLVSQKKISCIYTEKNQTEISQNFIKGRIGGTEQDQLPFYKSKFLNSQTAQLQPWGYMPKINHQISEEGWVINSQKFGQSQINIQIRGSEISKNRSIIKDHQLKSQRLQSLDKNKEKDMKRYNTEGQNLDKVLNNNFKSSRQRTTQLYPQQSNNKIIFNNKLPIISSVDQFLNQTKPTKLNIGILVHSVQIILQQSNPLTGKYSTIRLDFNNPYVTQTLACNKKLLWINRGYFFQITPQSKNLQINLFQQQYKQTIMLGQIYIPVSQLVQKQQFYLTKFISFNFNNLGQIQLGVRLLPNLPFKKKERKISNEECLSTINEFKHNRMRLKTHHYQEEVIIPKKVQRYNYRTLNKQPNSPTLSKNITNNNKALKNLSKSVQKNKMEFNQIKKLSMQKRIQQRVKNQILRSLLK